MKEKQTSKSPGKTMPNQQPSSSKEKKPLVRVYEKFDNDFPKTAFNQHIKLKSKRIKNKVDSLMIYSGVEKSNNDIDNLFLLQSFRNSPKKIKVAKSDRNVDNLMRVKKCQYDNRFSLISGCDNLVLSSMVKDEKVRNFLQKKFKEVENPIRTDNVPTKLFLTNFYPNPFYNKNAQSKATDKSKQVIESSLDELKTNSLSPMRNTMKHKTCRKYDSAIKKRPFSSVQLTKERRKRLQMESYQELCDNMLRKNTERVKKLAKEEMESIKNILGHNFKRKESKPTYILPLQKRKLMYTEPQVMSTNKRVNFIQERQKKILRTLENNSRYLLHQQDQKKFYGKIMDGLIEETEKMDEIEDLLEYHPSPFEKDQELVELQALIRKNKKLTGINENVIMGNKEFFEKNFGLFDDDRTERKKKKKKIMMRPKTSGGK